MMVMIFSNTQIVRASLRRDKIAPKNAATNRKKTGCESRSKINARKEVVVAKLNAQMDELNTIQRVLNCLLSLIIVKRFEVEKPRTIDVAVIEKPRSEPNMDAAVPYIEDLFPCRKEQSVVSPPNRRDHTTKKTVNPKARHNSVKRKFLRHHFGRKFMRIDWGLFLIHHQAPHMQLILHYKQNFYPERDFDLPF